MARARASAQRDCSRIPMDPRSGWMLLQYGMLAALGVGLLLPTTTTAHSSGGPALSDSTPPPPPPPPPPPSGRLVMSVADFGAVPDQSPTLYGADACDAFNRTIEAAREQRADVIRIPRGTYHFHWDLCPTALIYVSNTVMTPMPAKSLGLWFRDLADVVVEGEGSTLIFHGLMTPIVVDGSRNITIRDLDVDWVHPSVLEGLVVAATSSSFDLQLHPSVNYTVVDGGITFGAEGWSLDGVTGASQSTAATLCQEFDPGTDRTWRRSNPLGTPGHPAAVTQLAQPPGTIRVVTGTAAELPSVGHHLWFRSGDRQNVGLLSQYSRDVRFANVAMHFMSGFGAIAQFTENIEYHNFSVETTPESGRFCASSADMLQCSGCSGVLNISASRFVGSQDDAVNVHGTHLQIVAQPTPTSITVQFMHPESYGFRAFFPGDELQLTRADSLEGFGSAVVATVTVVNATHRLLVLDAPPATTDGGSIRLGYDVVENVRWCPDVVIDSSYFARMPTRGLLLTTRGKVVVRNSTLLGDNRALHISDDATSWFESGPVTDVHFVNNTVIRTGAIGPVIDLAPSATKAGTVHRSVRVENNTIHMLNGSKQVVLGALATAGLAFVGNVIHSPGRPLTPSNLVQATNCSGVVVANNTVVTT
eukprot:m.234632 g.234632  ORF g.234632 m.234632 type:complete len:647 (+) comp26130_c0_seq2:34-1974(+)